MIQDTKRLGLQGCARDVAARIPEGVIWRCPPRPERIAAAGEGGLRTWSVCTPDNLDQAPPLSTISDRPEPLGLSEREPRAG